MDNPTLASMAQAQSTIETIDVVDMAQLRRIEATHKGFLYQHLYCVACLLMLGQLGWTRMRVEADEDLELEFSGRYVYVQVKSRSDLIQFSDIASALKRFEQYRARHVPGSRAGQPEFVLALNRDPAPGLSKRISAGEFPQDVRFLRPGQTIAGLPPVLVDNEEAFNWCVARAEMLPFIMVAPDVLVQNLAGAMMRMAAGLDEFAQHEITAVRAAGMLEQFLQQVHEFPAPPLNYRPQDNEPSLATDAPIRLIVGFSGAGKTSWAAQAALADAQSRAYFDVADLPSSSVARALARELAARWLSDNPDGRQAVASEALSGVEALHLVTSSLKTQHQSHTVVVDNAHRLQVEDARAITAARGNLRLVFLAQPTPELDLMSTALDVEPETLKGWGADSIGYEASAQECSASMATAVRIRGLTAGLPLYVRSAISVAKKDYGSDLEAFCDAFEGQSLSTDTRQHTLLTVVFDGLDDPSKQVLACASLSDVPLSAEEIVDVAAEAFSLNRPAVVRKLRSLRARGLLQAYGSQRSKVHDAMRPIALEYLTEEPEAGRRARAFLLDLVETSLKEDRDKERFPLFVRLLIDLRDVAKLADLGTEEAFHEGPEYPQVWPVLEEAASDLDLAAEVRFECLDALLYHRQRHGPEETIAPLLEQMETLIDGGLEEDRPRLVFFQKSVIYWAYQDNEARVQDLLGKAQALLPGKASYRRVFAYTAALALWKVSRPVDAERLLNGLVAEYLAALSINIGELMSNPDPYAARVRADDDYGTDCKHLADCFDLLARVLEQLQRAQTAPRKFAVRLFEITGSWDSAARVGIDLVYQHLDNHELPQALKLASESLPELVHVYGLVRHTIPLRYLHAHVLGRMGQIPAAREVLRTADPFLNSLTSDEQLEAARLTDFLR
ncbi:AAA family ATPase [Burkholderia glumae]|uniref:AAA family ATPase n=2 Tax=Burkholderia glumae TaxID=337 RepID=UPI003B9AF53A